MKMEIDELPFNRALGLRIDGPGLVLDPRPEHLNHLDTVHATVIFGLAEAAAGHLLLRRFPDLSASFAVVLREATTRFRRPADPGSPLSATGSLGDDHADEFLKTLQSRGRATTEIAVSVTQNDSQILVGRFKWFAGRK